jgi:hypothetical protein
MDELISSLEAGRWNTPESSLEGLLLSLLTAFVLSQVVSWIYAGTHSGVSYSRNFTQSLILMSIVVSLVMYIIGNSLITAFGLMGAMAIIRFRNVLKDTRDTVFIFFILLLGMATGTQRFLTAGVGTCAFALVSLYLYYTSFGSFGRFDGHLTLRLANTGQEPEVNGVLHRFCKPVKRMSLRQSAEGDPAEYVFQLRLRDRNRSSELLQELKSVSGVSSLAIVLGDQLMEI